MSDTEPRESAKPLPPRAVESVGHGGLEAGAGEVEAATGLRTSYAWVEGGQVRIHHDPGTRYHPVLRPGPDVRLWVNGEPVSEARVILPGDEVRVEVVGGEQETPQIQHRVSLDRMHCFLSFKGAGKGRMKLMDRPPARELTLVAVPDLPGPGSALSMADLLQYLQDVVGVRVPINEDALERLLSGLEAEVQVAAGTPPGRTVNGWTEYLVPFSIERVQVTDETTDPVDYLDLRRIPTVKAGTTLAIVHPGRRGTPGTDVYGQVVDAPEPDQPFLKAGPGVQLVDDGRAAVAIRAGRPARQGHVLMVLPTYTVEGDVDVGTGHIRFDGDVMVLGNVRERTKVVSGGRVTVAGGVSGATVRGRLGVQVAGNVVSSTVTAGGTAATARALVSELKPLLGALERLVASVHYVKDQPAYQRVGKRRPPDGVLIKRLIELKFPNLPKLVERLHGRSKTFDETDMALEGAVAVLSRLLVTPGPLILEDGKELDEAVEQLRAASYRLEADASLEADIGVRHVQNAALHASGRVSIRNGSIFNSEVVAGTGITVYRGVVRGGCLQVFRGAISLDEVGSPLGARTHLAVIDDGSVQARLLHPNVVVEIAGRRYVADRVHRHVRFSLGEKGEWRESLFRTPTPA